MNWVMPQGDASRGSLSAIPDLKAWGIPTMEEYAGILQGIVGRVRDGTANSANAESNAQRVVPLAQFAAQYARKAGMPG